MIKIVLILFVLIISVQNVSAATVQDSTLIVEEFVTGLSSPTSISFIGSDILVLQKNDGKVRLIQNGVLQANDVLDLPVSNNSERGLLGIETVGTDVYLFFTEALIDGGSPIGNHVYKYFWNSTHLVNPVLIKNFTATPGPNHNGGVLTKDQNDNVFAIIGDLNRDGKLQNYLTGEPDDTSVILQVDPPGSIIGMGIRNSFGLAIDPVTGNMWDTENGPQTFDEVNLISPNFNSGWEVIMGPATQEQINSLPGFESFVYSQPEFSWEDTVAPTSIFFIDSPSFPNYSNNVFVGDCNNGNLYKFTLNQARDSFVFSHPDLLDLVLDEGDDATEIEFGTGFGCITDIEMGQDGFLYVSSLGNGIIYKIIPPEICSPPDNGTWIVVTSCTLNSYEIINGNVFVQSGATLIIPDGFTLDIDFTNFNLTVQSGGGVLIKSGGMIT